MEFLSIRRDQNPGIGIGIDGIGGKRKIHSHLGYTIVMLLKFPPLWIKKMIGAYLGIVHGHLCHA